MRDICDVIENVCDEIDRGGVNSVEDGVYEFEKCGLNVDMKLVRECLEVVDMMMWLRSMG